MSKEDILKGLNEDQKNAAEYYNGPSFIIAGPGSGKCIEGSSLIYTDKGMMEIKDVGEHYNINSNNECKADIRTLNLDQKEMYNTTTSHFYDMGESDTVKIVTSYGYSIEGTPEHPIIVLDKDGDIKFKKLSEIKDDDFIAISLNNEIWGKENLIEPDFSYLMGLLVGDGCLGQKGGQISFSNSDVNMSNAYMDSIFKYLNIERDKVSCSKSLITKTTDWNFYNIKAKNILKSYGLKMVGSGEKEIPDSILRSTRENSIEFMKGLFDTDGHFNTKNGNFEYCTKSKKLAQQVHLTLLNLGILSRLKIRNVIGYENDYYYIYISGSMLRKFREIIGFKNCKDKLDLLEEYCNNKKINDNNLVIPYQNERFRSIRTQIRSKSYYEGHTSRIIYPEPICLKRIISGKRNPSHLLISRVLGALDFKDKNTEYLKFLSENFAFDEIKEIKNSFNRVYDFTVPDTHSFVSNGIISHNTMVIISRTSYMIDQGISPENILLFTFTKKAAGEIKDRVFNKIGKKAEGITVSTYHSFCARILRDYAEYLDYKKNFSIYDTEDRNSLLKKIVKSQDIKPLDLGSMISYWKNKAITPLQASIAAKTDIEKLRAEYYSDYQTALREQNAFDFDDLICMTVKLLKENASVLEEINSKYKYITADEGHDSSERDLELLKLLAGEDENICIILDNEQSIYSFRYADIEAVMNIRNHFTDLKEFILRRNYRSTKMIVKASRSLIDKNPCQIKKELFSENHEGEKVMYFECHNAQEESIKIVKLIMAIKKSKGIKNKDISIIYRMSYLSRAIEDAFLKNGISYEIIGGCPFYSRKEIKDIMSYLRFAYNPQDSQAFERIINVPKRGIGKKSIDKIFDNANNNILPSENLVNLFDACQQVKLTTKAQDGIDSFNHVIRSIRQSIESGDVPAEIIKKITSMINYKTYLKESEKDTGDKLANIMELISIASKYETVDDFIYSMTLNSNIDEEENTQDKVKMLTAHASKGLEFKAVFIIGVNEGVMPHSRADTQKQIEEERRLFYVAMTRAEEFLFITRPKIVEMYGSRIYAKESRFIKEISKEYIHCERLK